MTAGILRYNSKYITLPLMKIFHVSGRFIGGRLLWLVMVLLLLLVSSHRTLATDATISTPPTAAKPLAAILKICQSKGHCPPYDLALLAHKHVTEWTCLKDYDIVKTDEKRYQLINGYLTIVDKWLQSKDAARQRSAVLIAWASAQAAKLCDKQMADQICTL